MTATTAGFTVTGRDGVTCVTCRVRATQASVRHTRPSHCPQAVHDRPGQRRGGSWRVALMTHDGDRSDVEIASRDDVQRFVTEALASLGLSFDELERQAELGRFDSDRARLVWMAIRRVARAPA